MSLPAKTVPKKLSPHPLHQFECECRVVGLKVLSFEKFAGMCCRRQENAKRYSECRECPCGTAILSGRLQALPTNVVLLEGIDLSTIKPPKPKPDAASLLEPERKRPNIFADPEDDEILETDVPSEEPTEDETTSPEADIEEDPEVDYEDSSFYGFSRPGFPASEDEDESYD